MARWLPVTTEMIVCRYVKHDDKAHPDFVQNFMSDGDRNEERGKELAPGEDADLLTGLSVFESEEKARKRWAEIREGAERTRSQRNKRRKRAIRMTVGDYIADIRLIAGEGFEIAEDDGSDDDGHKTIRGDKHKLAASCVRIYPAATDGAS